MLRAQENDVHLHTRTAVQAVKQHPVEESNYACHIPIRL